MGFESFLSDLLATLLGGVILAILFFWFREKIFPLPEVTGRWYFEMHTTNTAYDPYKDMVLRYIAMLWCEGHRIEGTAEKIYENSSTGEREYVGKHRTRSRVEGYIEKNYLGKDRLFLHLVEDGHGRESTNFFELEVGAKGTMSGSFSSMVANQDGAVVWQRKQF